MRLRVLLVVCAAVPALASPAGALIRKDGIAGVRLLMTPKEVWAVRGRPDRVVNRTRWQVGYLPLVYVYRRPRLRVEFLLGGKRLTVWSVATTDRAERTRNGVGVGDREARVRTYAPYCRSERKRRFCSTTNQGGVGGTVFELRRGRAVRVTVYAPVF